MTCMICLESNENSIDIAGDEGVRLNVAKIVFQFFSFCFESEPYAGTICRKCWLKIQMFHEFYVRIQSLHTATHVNESIFVSQIDTLLKVSLSTDEDDETQNCNQVKIEGNLSVEKTTQKGHGNSKSVKSKAQKLKTELLTKTTQQTQKRRKRGTRITIPVAPLLKRLRAETINEDIQISNNDIFPCTECEMKCLTKATLYRHLKEVHRRLEFKCKGSKCVQSFATQAALDEHTIQFHTRVPCPDCQKPIASFYLSEHKKLYHDESQHVVCDLCGKMSVNMRLHKTHYQCAHNNHEKLQCDICKALLSNKFSIRKHMSLRHIQQPVQCSICQKMFANKNSLGQHKRFHDDEMRRRIKCVVCGKGFRDKNNLRQHFSIHDNKVYKCPHCEKIYRHERTYKAHINQEHRIDASLPCGSAIV